MDKFENNKKPVLEWIQKTIVLITMTFCLVVVYALFNISLIPKQFLYIFTPISLAIVLFLAVYSFKARKCTSLKRIILIVLSFVIILANAFIWFVGDKTLSFLRGIQEDKYTYIEYSVVAKKVDNIKLSSAEKLSVSILQPDTHNDLVKNEVNKLTKAEYKDQSSVAALVESLDDNKTNVAVLKNAYLDLLDENYNKFYQSLTILATFTIKVEKNDLSEVINVTEPFVAYISGIDTAGDISTVSRSDVNILAVINPKTHKVLLVNTPRDYYVQLHGTKGLKDKLTHAGIYGVDMSIKTLEDLYDTNIGVYVKVNFSSLLKIIDAIGGVSVYSDQAFSAGGYDFEKGYNELNGKSALAFSRERYSFKNGDRTRGMNQQRVIEAIFSKMSDPSALTSFSSILNSMDEMIQTNAKEDEIAIVIQRQMNGLYNWQTESISVDGVGKSAPTYSMGSMNLYVMEPDQKTVNAAKQKIKQYLK